MVDFGSSSSHTYPEICTPRLAAPVVNKKRKEKKHFKDMRGAKTSRCHQLQLGLEGHVSYSMKRPPNSGGSLAVVALTHKPIK